MKRGEQVNDDWKGAFQHQYCCFLVCRVCCAAHLGSLEIQKLRWGLVNRSGGGIICRY